MNFGINEAEKKPLARESFIEKGNDNTEKAPFEAKQALIHEKAELGELGLTGKTKKLADAFESISVLVLKKEAGE